MEKNNEQRTKIEIMKKSIKLKINKTRTWKNESREKDETNKKRR